MEVYVTRDLEDAKTYVRARCEGAEDKRYGLLASSKASNLKQISLDTWNQGVKAYQAGTWFNIQRPIPSPAVSSPASRRSSYARGSSWIFPSSVGAVT